MFETKEMDKTWKSTELQIWENIQAIDKKKEKKEEIKFIRRIH